MVARAVVNVQAEVMEKHGLKGDAGYAQAQARRPRPESEHRRAAKRDVSGTHVS